MNKLNEKFIISVPDCGECEINLKELSKVWSKGFCISEWNGPKGEEFRLIRKGKKKPLMKMTISNSDAKELINMNSLSREQDGVFINAAMWK